MSRTVAFWPVGKLGDSTWRPVASKTARLIGLRPLPVRTNSKTPLAGLGRTVNQVLPSATGSSMPIEKETTTSMQAVSNEQPGRKPVTHRSTVSGPFWVRAVSEAEVVLLLDQFSGRNQTKELSPGI